MNRRDLTLAMLAAADGVAYSPVQIQKALFLITRNLPKLVTEGPNFCFTPYDYGPFDVSVYNEANALQRAGEAQVIPSPYGRYSTYAATSIGITKGRALITDLPPHAQAYMRTVSDWVRSQNFAGLVKSIYDAYPEMRENSIFQG